MPDYKAGDIAICDPEQPPLPGDLVGIWWKDGSKQPWIKQLVTPFDPICDWGDRRDRVAVIVKMLNPSSIIPIDPLHIDAIHKVIHVIQK